MVDGIAVVGLAGAPVVLAVVEVVKDSFPSIGTRWFPALVLAGGVLVNVGYAALTAGGVGPALLVGVVTGLVASGLYSQARAVKS